MSDSLQPRGQVSPLEHIPFHQGPWSNTTHPRKHTLVGNTDVTERHPGQMNTASYGPLSCSNVTELSHFFHPEVDLINRYMWDFIFCDLCLAAFSLSSEATAKKESPKENFVKFNSNNYLPQIFVGEHLLRVKPAFMFRLIP